MIPYVIPQLPLLFGTVLLLLITIGSFGCGANPIEHFRHCEKSKIKSVELFHYLSNKFLRIRNNSVVTDAERDEYHTLFTITIKEYGFLIYDPHARKFICLKIGRKRSKLVARKNPKMLDRCVFVENSFFGQYTRYEWFGDAKYVLSFNKNGLQRINSNVTEAQKFTKKLTSCSTAYKTFCERMRPKSEDFKIRRRGHKIFEHFKELCKIDRHVSN